MALALAALGWVLAEDERTQRFLALTGLVPADLRARAAEPALLAEVLGFITAHEPALIACADSLGLAPAALAEAAATLAAPAGGHADWGA